VGLLIAGEDRRAFSTVVANGQWAGAEVPVKNACAVGLEQPAILW